MISAPAHEGSGDTYREEFLKAEQAIGFAELSINSLGIIKASEGDKCCDKPAETPNGVVIPAINELRYSAKHYADYIADPSTPEQLQRAIRHCIRARFNVKKVALYNHRMRGNYEHISICIACRGNSMDYC